MNDFRTNDLASKLSGLSEEKRVLLEQKLKAKVKVEDGHALIARSLQRLGVTHVFGISGTPVYETHAACARVGIRVIGVRHQQAAAMAAAAQNYITGRLHAVVILSAGPAITNAATGILVAQDNGWPLLVLGGRRPLSTRTMGSFQELDAVPIFRSITKFAGTIASTDSIQESLLQAFEIATSGRPGPVYLEVPEEILQGKASADEPVVGEAKKPLDIDAGSIKQAALLLRHAERPVVIIGDGARWSEPFAELSELVARLGSPFITSPIAQGFLPDDHPLCYNLARSFPLSAADAVLIVGARLDWTFRFGAEIARDAKLIQVAFDRSEIGLNIAPTVGIVGDIKSVLRQLLEEIGSEPSRESAPRARWRQGLDEKRSEKVNQLNALALEDSTPMTAHRLIREIRGVVSRDAICIVDGNLILTAAQQLLPSYLPVSRLTPGNNGCMGTGIPFGIAAKLACPRRPVLVISGDLAFGFNAMEMETAVRLRIPVIIIVANNDGNSGTRFQAAFYPENYPDRVTMFQSGIRYDDIMRAFGGHGEFVEYPEQLKPALERAATSGLAACINVKVNPK